MKRPFLLQISVLFDRQQYFNSGKYKRYGMLIGLKFDPPKRILADPMPSSKQNKLTLLLYHHKGRFFSVFRLLLRLRPPQDELGQSVGHRPLLRTFRPLLRPLLSHRRDRTEMLYRGNSRRDDGDRFDLRPFLTSDLFGLLVFDSFDSLMLTVSIFFLVIRFWCFALFCTFALEYFSRERTHLFLWCWAKWLPILLSWVCENLRIAPVRAAKTLSMSRCLKPFSHCIAMVLYSKKARPFRILAYRGPLYNQFNG